MMNYQLDPSYKQVKSVKTYICNYMYCRSDFGFGSAWKGLFCHNQSVASEVSVPSVSFSEAAVVVVNVNRHFVVIFLSFSGNRHQGTQHQTWLNHLKIEVAQRCGTAAGQGYNYVFLQI